MKKIIVSLLVGITCVNIIGCNQYMSNNAKAVDNVVESEVAEKNNIYGKNDLKAIKEILKDCGSKKDLSVEKAKEKNMFVIKDRKIQCNENLWKDFADNSKENKDDEIIILKYTEQGDPILTYLSYLDGNYFMVEDESRNNYKEGYDKDYYEYSFKYLRMFEDDNYQYAYLLDDKDITLEALNYSLLSSNEDDWVPYGFIFYIEKL
ncbi:MAG: DUF4362 domain-containing protein [Terrisporobacter sp.]